MKTLALAAAVFGLQAFTNTAFAEVPTPTLSQGFDGNKNASAVLDGTARSSWDEWPDSATYTAVRGRATDKALTLKDGDSSTKTVPNSGNWMPTGFSDSTSWSIHASMILAEVSNAPLFSVSTKTWGDSCVYIGVEYVGNNQVRVVYGSGKQATNKKQLIAPVTVSDSKAAYHSYLLTFNASASGTAESPYYTLYVDGVKKGDSGTIAKHTGYASGEHGCAVGNYYGGADQTGGAPLFGAKVDDFAIWATTCLSAAQAVELAAKFPSKPIQNAYLWLDASDFSTITRDASGQVTSWATRSVSGRSAISYTTSPVTAGPTVLTGALAGKNVVDFGAAGSNKDLKFDRATNVRAVFMVTQVEQNNNVFLLGDSESFNFHRGEKNTVGYYFSENHACDVLVDGTYRNRVKVSSPRTTVIPSDYGLISIVASSDVAASRICQDRAQSGRNGGKKVAELIILTDEITESQRDEIEQYLTNKWFPNAPTPDMSFGFDNGKEASKILGGTAQTGMEEWDNKTTPTYTLVRGSSSDYAMGIKYNPNVAPYNGVPSGMSDSQSWSVHASMKLAEVANGVLFGISGAVWDNKQFIGVEYVGSNKVRVKAGYKNNEVTLMDNISVTDATGKYHSYLLTFNASAAGTAESPYYTLYVDGVKVGDSGTAAKRTGYVVDWCVGNYYGGADSVGGAVFAGAQVDDFAIWATTCLTATQAADLAGKFPTWPNIFTATVTDDANWSELSWSPEKPSGGFPSNAELTISNTATDATVTIDETVSAGALTVTSASGKNLTLALGSGTLTAKTYDFTGAVGKVTLGYGVDTATVKAGTDSVVNSVTANTTINIDSGKKLTVKDGTVVYSKTTNNGTLNFEGGDSSAPIVYTADGAANVDLGTMTLAASTYVKISANANKLYKVTGKGATTSFLEIVNSVDKGIGTKDDSQFRSLTLVANVNAANDGFWIQSAAVYDSTVNVVANKNIYLYNCNPTIGTLSGSADIKWYWSAGNIFTLTITPTANAEYTGASTHNFVIAKADGTQTLSGAYTGALTVNAGGKCKLTGNANPSSITDNGTLDIGTKRGLTIVGSGTVDVTLTAQEETQVGEITAFTQGGTATVGKVYASDGKTEVSVTKNGNKFTINFAAKIGETGYITLAKAIEAASGTCTITLLADATLPEEAALNAAATLVCGDFAISGAGSINVASGSSLSIAAGVIGVDLGGSGSFNLTGGFYKSNTPAAASGYRYVALSAEYKNCKYEIVAGSKPSAEDEKVYAAGDEGTIVVSESDLASRGYTIPEGGVQALLNGTGDNGVPNWKNVVLNLKTDDATSFPIVAAQAASSATQIAFNLGGVKVDTASGATVTYKVMTKDSTGVWTTQPTEYAHGATATVDLPTSGVKYYKLDVIVTPAK